MRRFVEGADRGQNTLFPEYLEDWIDQNNPVRVAFADMRPSAVAKLLKTAGISIKSAFRTKNRKTWQNGHAQSHRRGRLISMLLLRRFYTTKTRRWGNRPAGVKRFQTIHHCSVDVAHGLALLFGLGTKALPSWDSKTRWNNLWGGLAVSRR